MPGRDKLREIARIAVYEATAAAGHIGLAAEHPGHASWASVASHAATAHEAIDRAAEACKILVREGE